MNTRSSSTAACAISIALLQGLSAVAVGAQAGSPQAAPGSNEARLASAPSAIPPVGDPPASAAKSAPYDFDAGPVMTLRCVGGNGVFDSGPESDDLVCTAPVTDDPTPSILVVRYRFPGVKPMFQRCRFVRGTPPPPAELNCP